MIWLGFNWLSDGAFLSSRNLWNLLVFSTASIAVMACGMVLVIVTRNIDLRSAPCSASSAWWSAWSRSGCCRGIWSFEHPLTWIVSLVLAIGLGGLVGLLQGALIAYLAILLHRRRWAALLIWRGTRLVGDAGPDRRADSIHSARSAAASTVLSVARHPGRSASRSASAICAAADADPAPAQALRLRCCARSGPRS